MTTTAAWHQGAPAGSVPTQRVNEARTRWKTMDTTGCAGIDPRTEQLLSVPEQVRDFIAETTGRQVSSHAIWFWIRKGLRPFGGGARVRLPALRLGSVTYTSVEALARFGAASAGQGNGRLVEAGEGERDRAPRRPKRSSRAVEAAAFLDKEGL